MFQDTLARAGLRILACLPVIAAVVYGIVRMREVLGSVVIR